MSKRLRFPVSLGKNETNPHVCTALCITALGPTLTLNCLITVNYLININCWILTTTSLVTGLCSVLSGLRRVLSHLAASIRADDTCKRQPVPGGQSQLAGRPCVPWKAGLGARDRRLPRQDPEPCSSLRWPCDHPADHPAEPFSKIHTPGPLPPHLPLLSLSRRNPSKRLQTTTKILPRESQGRTEVESSYWKMGVSTLSPSPSGM